MYCIFQTQFEMALGRDPLYWEIRCFWKKFSYLWILSRVVISQWGSHWVDDRFQFCRAAEVSALVPNPRQLDFPVRVPSSGTGVAWCLPLECLLTITFSVLFDVHRRKKVIATVNSFLADKSALRNCSLWTSSVLGMWSCSLFLFSF